MIDSRNSGDAGQSTEHGKMQCLTGLFRLVATFCFLSAQPLFLPICAMINRFWRSVLHVHHCPRTNLYH